MKILITGASGYIGSSLVNYLTSNTEYLISCVVRHKIEDNTLNSKLYKANIYELESLDIEQIVRIVNPDIVVHLASYFVSEHKNSDIGHLIQSNIEFPTKLLEAMRANQVTKFINTGTSWQNFNSKEYDPVNLYAATKESFSKIITYYTNCHELNAITLKIFDTYGPKDTRKKIIPLLADLSQSQNALDMSLGHQKIDLVHIDDVCSAYLVAINRLIDNRDVGEKEYAIKTGHGISLRELVKLYEDINNIKLNINWGARSYRSREVMEPCDNIDVLMDWKPKISLREGLKSLIYESDKVKL